MFLNEEVVEVKHTPKPDFVEPLVTSNVVISAFTTASARLRLFEALQLLVEGYTYFNLLYIGNILFQTETASSAP